MELLNPNPKFLFQNSHRSPDLHRHGVVGCAGKGALPLGCSLWRGIPWPQPQPQFADDAAFLLLSRMRTGFGDGATSAMAIAALALTLVRGSSEPAMAAAAAAIQFVCRKPPKR